MQRQLRPFEGDINGLFFYDNIDVKVSFYSRSVGSKIFTHDPFQSVADYGISDFFGYRDPEAASSEFIGAIRKNKVTVGNALPMVQ
jgi:hypothetical protein